MELITLARPYARAAFSVASEKLELLSWWTDALHFSAEVVKDRAFAAYSRAPTTPAQQLLAAFLGVVQTQQWWARVAPKQQEEWKSFLHILLQNHKFFLLPEIARQFEVLCLESQNQRRATVYSPYPLSDAQLASIMAQVSLAFSQGKSEITSQLLPQVEIVPHLMAGVRVAVGDWVLDASIERKLEHLEQVLL